MPHSVPQPKETVKTSKFLVFSEDGDILDVALRLKKDGHDVLMRIVKEGDRKIGEGLIEKTDDWFSHIGQGFIWVFDSCSFGKLQDWLRSKGEYVFGGSEVGDKLENDRQLGQKWFKRAGFNQPESRNFKDIDAALDWVKSHTDKKWVLKQNGDAPKSINYVGKFDGSLDMIYHLEELKQEWSDVSFGPFDCDLMEKVEGLEVAASAFFNGKDWMRDAKGKVVGYLNFEEKKECDGGLGETTGEMGTLFKGVDESNKIFKDILLRDEIKKVLKNADFRGVFDLNGMLLSDGSYVVFEATCRFGVPSTSYELLEGLQSDLGGLLESVAKGEQKPIEVSKDWGIVQVLSGKPYPLGEDSESNLEPASTSIDEKIWTLLDGNPVEDWSEEQMKHIHLCNVHKDGNHYKISTKNGYVMTITSSGSSIKEVRDKCLSFIKGSIYFAGMKYRQDIGKRVEDYKMRF